MLMSEIKIEVMWCGGGGGKINIGMMWPEMVVAILFTRWMHEWMDELSWFFMLIQIHENTKISVSAKDPTSHTIAKDCRITNLIVSWCHDQVAHAGRGITINQVRIFVFWVIGLNIVVRSMISKCVRCKHLRGRRLQQQKMADLPRGRMSEEAPFTSCGVDMFGPFVVKNQGRI